MSQFINQPLAVPRISGISVVGANPPIISNRAPTTNDKAPIGTFWIQPVDSTGAAVNGAWVLTSIISNVATWSDFTGGAGVFTSLSVSPGSTALVGAFSLSSGAGNTAHIADDATDHNVTIGSTTGASGLSLNAGTSGITGTTSATGTITLGAASMTGNIIIGQSTAGQAVSISGGINTGAQSVSLASGANAANSTVNINNGAFTAGVNTTNIGSGAAVTAGSKVINIGQGASSVNQTVNILSDTPTGGVQTLNLGAQNTTAVAINIGSGSGVATVGIANSAHAHVVSIGSTNGAASTTINSGNVGLSLDVGAVPSASNPGILITQGTVPFRLMVGAGAPANGLAIEAGDLYIRSDPAGATSRMYIATGAGAWTNVTCAA